MCSYKFNVSLYLVPPSHYETLESMLLMCKQRLQVYRIIFNLKQTGKKQCAKEHFLELPLFRLFSHEESVEVQTARRTDDVSHFTLFLAHCETAEMFKLFTFFERKWFEVRYKSMSIEKQREFRQAYNINLLPVSDEELNRLNNEREANLTREEIQFKVPWTECPDLVSLHKCFLDSGWAYISERQLVYWLSQKMLVHLQDQFERIAKQLASSELDERLQVIFSRLNLIRNTHPRYYCSTPITLETFDSNVKHFPLCMKLHHEKLKRAHHLIHRERLQYSRFLKTIGLELKEALELFRNEFTQIMSEKAFDGEHVYKLKHVYGVVGSRIEYTSYTCQRILDIEELNAIGCPFKKLSSYTLKCYLGRDEALSDGQIERILEIKNGKNYQLACTACLKFSSKLRLGGQSTDHNGDLILDPVQYYDQSCNVNYTLEDIYCDSGSESE